MCQFHKTLDHDTRRTVSQRLVRLLSPLDIWILYGGWDQESAVSVAAARRIEKELADSGLSVRMMPADAFAEALLRHPPDMVVNVLYGPLGEGGAVSSLMARYGVPTTHSGPAGCPIALDKWRSKLLLSREEIPISWSEASFGTDHEDVIDRIDSRADWPVVCKPLDQGCSIGVELCHNAIELKKALSQHSCFSGSIVEPYLAGREYSVAVFETEFDGAKAFPVLEIANPDGIADQTAKYSEGGLKLTCPANISENKASQLATIALTAYRVLGCHPLLRVDLREDSEGQPHLLEANHFPGLTPHSWFPLIASRSGWDYQHLLLAILRAAALRGTPRSRVNKKRELVRPRPRSSNPSNLILTVPDPLGDRSSSLSAAANLSTCFPRSMTLTISDTIRAMSDPTCRSPVIDVLYETWNDTVECRGVLDALGAKRIGPSLLCCSLATDKFRQRCVAAALEIPQPRWRVGLLEADDNLRWPRVAKQRRMTNSKGVHLLATQNEWQEWLSTLEEMDNWLVEEYLPGPEIHVGLLTWKNGEVACLPPALIEVRGSGSGILSADDKLWGRYSVACPAELSNHLVNYLCSLSLELHKAFDAPAMARVEWRIDEDGGPRLVEYDHLPGLGPKSIYPQMLNAAGLEWRRIFSAMKTVPSHRGLINRA